ncbi:MAG TPA: hypothetical protein VG406_11625 [Isosphaeraceae bacterium]|jgi:hypothetical protein|nr:hypothetical protein [Isosphaeraceae bacterium]
MTLNLELSPALEARLSEEAARRGISTEEYARTLLEGALGWPAATPEGGRPFYETATPEEWEREFDAMIEELGDETTPVIPMELLRREHLYEDRGL